MICRREFITLLGGAAVAADLIAVLVVKSAAPATPVVCAVTQVDGLMGKQVELVRELMPHATTVGVLVTSAREIA